MADKITALVLVDILVILIVFFFLFFSSKRYQCPLWVPHKAVVKKPAQLGFCSALRCQVLANRSYSYDNNSSDFDSFGYSSRY